MSGERQAEQSIYDHLTARTGPWARQLGVRRYRRRQLVFQPFDRPVGLYLVHQGHVRIYRLTPEGREVTYGLLGPGDIFGEAALVTGGQQNAFAEVMADAEIALLPAENFRRLLATEPALAYRVMIQLSDRLRQAEDLVEDLVHRDVAARVARTLLHLADDFGRPTSRRAGVVIDLRIPYQEIANMVGSTRETVTRAISEMQQNEWVLLEQGRLYVMDREALQLLGE